MSNWETEHIKEHKIKQQKVAIMNTQKREDREPGLVTCYSIQLGTGASLSFQARALKAAI